MSVSRPAVTALRESELRLTYTLLGPVCSGERSLSTAARGGAQSSHLDAGDSETELTRESICW